MAIISVGLASVVPALCGGTLWSMARVFAVAFAPVAPRRRDLIKVSVEALFALISAAIGGFYIAPFVDAYLKVTEITSVSIIGLSTGLILWRAIPLISDLLLRVTSLRLGAFFKVSPPPEPGATQ